MAEDGTELPKESWRKIGKDLAKSGGNAANVAIEKLVGRAGASAAEIAAKATGHPEAHARRVVKAHTLLARGQGAAVASGLTVAEVTTVVGTEGTLTPGAVAVGLLTDLTGLAWIQIRMVLIVAALYGFDPQHPDRVKELGALMGLTGPVTTQRVAQAAGKGVPRVIKRLTLRYLKGDTLRAVKSMFQLVGMNFNRTGMLKQLPMVNIPISMVVNGGATAALGKRAITYYGTLAPPVGSAAEDPAG